MNALAQAWKQRFEAVWDPEGPGRYRLGSPGQRLAPRFAPLLPPNALVYDYGSGTGRAACEILRLRPDCRVRMFDLAENAIEEEAQSKIGGNLEFTPADIAALPADLPVADWGYCIDCLMTVSPEVLDAVLSGIRRTCRNLFCQVYDWSDVRCGMELTTIRQDGPAWEAMLRRHWPVVERLPSKEHPQRYIFICRGGAETPEITVGCCWDGRDYYTPDYVNKLRAMVARHLSLPHDFVCYLGPEADRRLDEIEPTIRTVQTGLPYWWSGMMFWRPDPPGIETDAILYLDLDQVVVGSLNDLACYPSDHAAMKDYPAAACPRGHETDGCVSTTLIRRGAGAGIWQAYCAAGRPQWDPTSGRRGPLPMAAQGIMNDPAARIPHDCFPEAWIASYKNEVVPRGLPADCRIVSFHGRPKPHEVGDAFVKEHWRV